MLEKDRKKDKQQAAQSAFQAKLNNIRKATKR
jgi:hypothetical protein